MNKRILWLVVSSLMALVLVMAACGPTATPTAPVTPTTPATPTAPVTPTTPATPTAPVTSAAPTGKWWDKFGVPQYGGTITARLSSDITDFDPYFFSVVSDPPRSMFMESLGMIKWALDRQDYSGAFLTRVRNEEHRTGLLAESWEQPDPQTIIFHIRKGVRWQDKPPVNGREFTAVDVVYHYSRLRGLGEFKTGSPTRQLAQFAILTSVTAPDKYSVQFKYSEPSIEMLDSLLDDFGYSNIVAREVVDRYGDARDYRNAVGTGAWILKDSVPGSSTTYVRNPNYWGYSEWYPSLKLPFADGAKFMIIPDTSTAQAAMRTGKIDLLNTSWEDAATLKKTASDLIVGYRPTNGTGVGMKTMNKPFTDTRVRQALQMAIDRKAIAETYYGGLIDDTPYGLMGPAVKGWYTPFAEWQQELKNTYGYNPEGAKKLLAEAGYPNGFKTEMVLTAPNVDLMSIAKYYFAQIGVDVEFKVMETAVYNNLVNTGKQQAMMPLGVGGANPPRILLTWRYSTYASATNGLNVNDPVYDKMVDTFFAAANRDEQKRIVLEADMYAIKQQWTVVLAGSTVSAYTYQPWLKGFSGEEYNTGYHYARFWIDQDLKKAMGR